MKTARIAGAGILALTLWASSTRATEYFVSPSGGNVAPFASWDTAATNIQDAIDAASASDVVWVTNGVYTTGGKVMAGDLTNRVALNKALTVQSVNGPFVTTIQGVWDPSTTNGPLAARCAWLTNGALLKGFTLQGGATRSVGDLLVGSGGGAWCSSSSGVIANCVVVSNAAFNAAGGVYSGSVNNSAIMKNSARNSGGGTYNANLNNCTVVSNFSGGTFGGQLTNCIVYYNTPGNWGGGPLYFCCTVPTPVGNIGVAPQLLTDGIHLASTSPCIAAGTNVVSGNDIDGQPWASPPSIGCDEWYGPPSLKSQPRLLFTVDPGGFAIGAPLIRNDPVTCLWSKDGVPLIDGPHLSGSHTPTLAANGVAVSDAGTYQIVLSNAFGMTTGTVVQVVIHCVDAAGTNPAPPFLDWSSAANSIQDAIEAALSGEIVLVTNGVYANGGKVRAGDLTNRVVLDKPLLVISANGRLQSSIQGAYDPATNGPAAVRCAWLTNGAVLSGFTLQGGATRNTGDSASLQSGGGMWGSSSNAICANCNIVANYAASSGGGAFQAGLIHCALTGNSATGNGLNSSGGGAYLCNMTNCSVSGNFSSGSGGGVALGSLRNCAITKNVAGSSGGGFSGNLAANGGVLLNCTIAWNTAPQGGGSTLGHLTNCIVYNNRAVAADTTPTNNYFTSVFAFSCTTPTPAGPGNIGTDPQLLGDGVHLAPGSPCIGAGLAIATGTDIDGQPWANPPSIGCDEWLASPLATGPPQTGLTGIPPVLNLWSVAAGQPPFTYSWLKDGILLEDGLDYTSTHTTNLTVNAFGPVNAGSYQLVVSNVLGMATSAVAQVIVHCANAAAAAPAAPYTDWLTAATNLQDAVDAASPGEFVLVTNGVYATGGRVIVADLTNRIAVNKPLIVTSMSGARATVIHGAYDPATINGPLAVRCAWLAQGATLRGLTLSGGATRNSGDTWALQSGGGAWCSSTNEMLLGCILSNNMAASYGGAAYQGQLQRSVLWGNAASYGGGAYNAFLANSLVRSNAAASSGGGLHSSKFVNCTVIANIAPFNAGGGEWGSAGWNSIVFYNIAPGSFYQFDYNDWDNSSKLSLYSSWTTTGSMFNTTPGPQLVADGIHLAATSPCRGAGNALYASGTDLDGEPWLNPPSIGCDEFYDMDASGPLLLGPITAYALDLSTPVIQNTHTFVQTHVTGNANRVAWSFGDGTALTNSFTFVALHVWTNAGDYNVTFTAYNHDNPGGVTTNALIHVVPPSPPTLVGSSTNGTTFTLSFAAQADVTYIVEQTTNLTPPTAWQSVGSVYGLGKQAQATDSSATNVMRFYRVRVQ